jgi:uncharacterized membrane protein (UPF0127 family)
MIADKAQATQNSMERFEGWMRKTETQPGEGILISPASAIHTMGMKINIDAVFTDQKLKVTKVHLDLAPKRLAWGSWTNLLLPWRSMVLELPVGAANLVRPGDILEVSERT